MKATITDVAREAGVSVATVSRVVNDSGSVRPETRRRIQEIAARLRYSPNGAARSLSLRRTHALGVLLPDLYGEFFSEVIRGLDQTAQERGYHLLVSSAHDGRASIEAALRAMRGRVDGLILMSPDLDARSLEANLPESLPVVLLCCSGTSTAYDAINIDNTGGASAMVRHLVASGHRRIAIIKGKDGNHDAAERLAAYRATLRAAGIEADSRWEADGDFTEQSGFLAARRLLVLSPRPTAIFAANDSMAIGALSALRQDGFRVPGSVSVAGFDDIPIARYMSPALTSVHVPIQELGERAMEALLRAVEEKNQHARRQEVLPTRLVMRHSCGVRAR